MLEVSSGRANVARPHARVGVRRCYFSDGKLFHVPCRAVPCLQGLDLFYDEGRPLVITQEQQAAMDAAASRVMGW